MAIEILIISDEVLNVIDKIIEKTLDLIEIKKSKENISKTNDMIVDETLDQIVAN